MNLCLILHVHLLFRTHTQIVLEFKKLGKTLKMDWKMHINILGIADNKINVKIDKFKMTDSIWGTN